MRKALILNLLVCGAIFTPFGLAHAQEAPVAPSSDVLSAPNIPVAQDLGGAPSVPAQANGAQQAESSVAPSQAPSATAAAQPSAAKEEPVAEPPALDVSSDVYFSSDAAEVPEEGDPMEKIEAPQTLATTNDAEENYLVVQQTEQPKSRKAQLVAAKRAFKLGRYHAALKFYNELHELNPKNPEVLMGRAMTLQHLGQNEGAIFVYEDLLELEPENLQARVNMLGLLMFRYPSVALRQLEDLRKNHPDNVGIMAQLAVLYAARGMNQEAITAFESAATLEPQNAGHLFNIAVIADRTGDVKKAVSYYEKALETDTIYGGGKTVPRDSIFERLSQLR